MNIKRYLLIGFLFCCNSIYSQQVVSKDADGNAWLSPAYQSSGYKNKYGYEYRYDGKGRLVKKILPQCEYTQYWYDTAGRMKFMQDATLRSRGLYRFMLYDKHGRLCIQGTCSDCWRGEAVNTATYNTSGAGFQNTGYSLGRYGDVRGTIEQITHYYPFGVG